MRAMEHSIAAKYAARPAARFVRPSSRARQRRLGLHATGTFQPAPDRATVLRTVDLGPLLAMRAATRTIQPARSRRAAAGTPRPVVTMNWARSGRTGATHRRSAAMAPWRG
jgi:hypothetical protein